MQRLGHRGVGNGVRHGGVHEPRDGDDLASLGTLDGHALEPAEGEDLGRAALLDDVAVDVQRLDRHVDGQRSALDPAGQDAAEEGIAVEQRRKHLELAADIARRRRDVADDRVEQRRQVALANVVRHAGVAGAAARVEGREIELLVVGVEVEEELEHFVEHFRRTCVGAVDLVDDDDRLEAERERLAGDELGLRHRPFGGVDEEDDAVDHAEDALDLGAEVGVTGGVDDVDVGAVPVDRRALRKDGDPALLLEVVRIHRPLLDALVVAEGPRLAEELVDKRGLAVVDVRDDRDVTQFHLIFSGKSERAM